MSDAVEKYPQAGGIFYACFNSRDDELAIARKAVIKEFGIGAWSRIKRINKTGLLAMFHIDPTPETKFFAERIAEQVEARAVRDGWWMFGKPESDHPEQPEMR